MPKIKKITKTYLLALLLTILFTSPTYAAPCSQELMGVTYEGIQTGIGCVPTSPTGLATYFILFASWTTSGIAMLLLIYGGFKILTSSGDPKALGEGREIITSAIAGLLLIIFAVAILRIIGFNILGIPFFKP